MTRRLGRRRLKKAPLPFGSWNADSEGSKLINILIRKFQDMFEGKYTINERERIVWGKYLSDLDIFWDIASPCKVDGDCWEPTEGSSFLFRPKGLEDHMRVGDYYFPKELALKILVLGFMP